MTSEEKIDNAITLLLRARARKMVWIDRMRTLEQAAALIADVVRAEENGFDVTDEIAADIRQLFRDGKISAKAALRLLPLDEEEEG